MEIKNWKDGEAVLYAEAFKNEFESSLADVLDDFEQGDIYFAECHDDVLTAFPLVVLDLKTKDKGEAACAYICLENNAIDLVPSKLSMRKISPRDIGRKFCIPYRKTVLGAKVIMGKSGNMAIKVKKSALF